MDRITKLIQDDIMFARRTEIESVAARIYQESISTENKRLARLAAVYRLASYLEKDYSVKTSALLIKSTIHERILHQIYAEVDWERIALVVITSLEDPQSIVVKPTYQ